MLSYYYFYNGNALPVIFKVWTNQEISILKTDLIIKTNSIFAQRRIVGTFVNVGTLLTVAAESVVAHTLEGAEGVDAARVRVAAAVIRCAFVDVLLANKNKSILIIDRLYPGSNIASVLYALLWKHFEKI